MGRQTRRCRPAAWFAAAQPGVLRYMVSESLMYCTAGKYYTIIEWCCNEIRMEKNFVKPILFESRLVFESRCIFFWKNVPGRLLQTLNVSVNAVETRRECGG